MGSRERDIVTEMKLLFKKLMKLAVLERGSLIGTIVKTFIGLMKNTVIDSQIMKNDVLQIREFTVIETVGKRKDFHDASLIEKRVFTQILYHNSNYNDTIIKNK